MPDMRKKLIDSIPRFDAAMPETAAADRLPVIHHGADAPDRLRAMLHKETRGEAVYTALVDAILERRLQPGVRLSEEALGDAFGVSRTLVRQALIRLTAEGIAVAERHRGCAVASLTPDQAEQVLAARRLVESELARLAARRASRADCDELIASIADEKAAAERGDHGTEIRLSGEFHLLVALVAGNQPLFQFLRLLVSQTALIISQYERGNAPSCSLSDHTEFIDAIRAGDARAAERLMGQHLDHIRARLSFAGPASAPDLRVLFSRDASRETSESK
jgi:DNA-binding GntR family transcriptional regulator